MGGEALRAARALLAAALLLASCAPIPPPTPAADAWASPLDRDHPLVGRIFDLGRRAEVSEPDLVASLREARFVLLGESHENADHHRLQARLVAALAAGGRPAVAFEMLRADQQAALDAALAGPGPSAEAVRRATGWDASGWPPFRLYAPIFEAALSAGLPLVAANLSREELAQVASDDPVSPGLRARLGLDEPLPEALERALERDLLAAHCHRLPESELPRMVRVQRARDAALAEALVRAAGGAQGGAAAAEAGGVGAILIAGAEHVRTDRGAPRTLARLAPGARRASVAFLEVDSERRDAWSDLAARYGPAPVFDFVWYTPRASDEDYCQRIRRKE